MRRLLPLALALGGLGALGFAPQQAWAGPPPMGPGMPDPSQMSGIPRPDPNLTPGTVTVRCLDGGFAGAAVGIEVTLEITTDAGVVERKAQTVEQGRATFTGLDEFLGSSVVAKATVAGAPLSSQVFTLGAQAGIALLLVKPGAGAGAPTQPAGAPQGGQGADPHGGQGAVPLPGRPFPLAGRPRGTLIVGALDLGNGGTGPGGMGAVSGIEVVLEATGEGLEEPLREVQTTDEEGRATFEKLDERLPEGAQIVVSVALEQGEAPKQSESFGLGESAYAVVFTRGRAPAQQPAQPQAPAQRMQLPGPRVDRTLPAGQVRVVLIDAHDQPVAGQDVLIHSTQAAGAASDRRGTTNDEGVAIIEGIELQEDMLSQVRVVYGGAPYSSTLYEMPKDTGAIVMLRVFEPTTDRTRVRSALQIDVSPRENDFAAVSFNYAVFVDGDEAFYVPGGIKFSGIEGTASFHVLEDAENYLLHDGEAPYATLDRPLEPGVELRLSFAVGVKHDGTLEIDWVAPFPLVEDASMVTVPEVLSVTRGVGGAPEVNPHAARDGGALELYKLGPQPFETGMCDELAALGYPCMFDAWGGHELNVTVEELPVTPNLWRWIAWSLFGVTGTVILASVALRRRVGAREALLARRDALWAELLHLDERGDDEPLNTEQRVRRVKILRTLDRIYRQLEALDNGSASAKVL